MIKLLCNIDVDQKRDQAVNLENVFFINNYDRPEDRVEFALSPGRFIVTIHFFYYSYLLLLNILQT